ncbi:exonuclease SbcCD subunit D [Sporolactobacillus kofuensis]|uniref:Exonuclease SbcCD subunit D n=1 Tax=Sporolactobacillus kofuensis TaxID=269672 RepID=A0ABW1WGQ1_9BACL|nr:DNA repair exonuclease [Sporolactobacillus kofuensis]MCO7176854.1 DNA repair exonuclease [Sporolactobacillus kofuensis]
MIRFVHAADLHLDRPFEGLTTLPEEIHKRAAESTFQALRHLVDKTIHSKADFLIIAGDIFDNSHRSIKAQRAFISEMGRLEQAGIPVYISYGNHDFINQSWNHLTLPDNVHVFPETPSMFSLQTTHGLHVHLYGFSYQQRWIHTDMAAQYSRTGQADYHIALLHGEQRNPNDSGKYAPFTQQELIEKGFDYWALGHIHKRQQLAVPAPIWYPGDIQGLSFKESELGEKGASLVELDAHGAHVHFFQTSVIYWDREKLPFTGPLTAENLEEALTKLKEKFREKHHACFIRVAFSFADPGRERNDVEDMVKELIDAVNEDESDQSDFIWLIQGECSYKSVWDKQEVMTSSHFVGDLFRFIEEQDSVDRATELLYHHHSAKKYLTALTPSEQQQIRAESEQLLADALLSLDIEKQ